MSEKSRKTAPRRAASASARGLVAFWLSASVAVCFGQSPATPAAPQSAAAPADPFAMDLNSLFNTRVTTASRFDEKLSDAAGVVSVVTSDELARFGGTTLLETLQRVAGLNLSSSVFAGAGMVAIRGDQTRADAGHILILINGRPVREVLQGGVSGDVFESFPISVLERIEVVKGPGSVLYGSGAFSGVINLITKKADGNEVLLSVAGGAAGEQAATESVMFRKGPLSVTEGGQSHKWPRWNITERGAVAGGSQDAAIRNEGTGGYLGIDYKGLSFMTSYTQQEAPSFVRGIVGDTRLKRGFADLGYSLQATPKWRMTFNATYDRSTLDAPDYPVVHRDSYEGDLEWTSFVTFSENNRLTFGAAYNHIHGLEKSDAPPYSAEARGSRNAGEGYVQFEHRLSDSIRLIGGVQANKIGRIGVDVDPRGGVVWSPSSRVAAKLLYGAAYNAPSLDQLLIDHPGLRGNPNLLSEEVGTLDAQISYQSNRVQASIDYFRLTQRNLIVKDVATVPASYYNNPVAIHFQGGEAEGKFYVKRDWFLTASAIYQVNDSGPGALNLSPGPATVVKAGASYRPASGPEFSLFDAYQGHVAGYGATLNPPAASFHALGFHARYDLTKRLLPTGDQGLAMFVNAEDLMNRPIWLPALGYGPGQTIPVIRGRTVFFGIEVWQKKVR